MRVWAASLLGAVVLVGASASSATPGTPPVPDVTVIADSVMTAVTWHSNARAVMQKGLQMIDIEPIRERFSAVAPFLDERGRRLVAAAEETLPSGRDARLAGTVCSVRARAEDFEAQRPGLHA